MFRYSLLVSALALGLLGCGAKKATVSGTVTFKGLPLPSGTVLFHGADGRIEKSLIAPDGKYTIDDAPIGPVRITVQSHGAAPRFPPSGVKVPAVPAELAPRPEDLPDSKFIPIPARFLDSGKSGLTYQVRAGRQAHDIEMRP